MSHVVFVIVISRAMSISVLTKTSVSPAIFSAILQRTKSWSKQVVRAAMKYQIQLFSGDWFQLTILSLFPTKQAVKIPATRRKYRRRAK